jgi:hypothetical protein
MVRSAEGASRTMQARVRCPSPGSSPGAGSSRRGFAAPQDEAEVLAAHNVKQPRVSSSPSPQNSGSPEFCTIEWPSRIDPTWLGERVGVRGFGPKIVCNPSPGSLRSPPSPYGGGKKAKRHRPVICQATGAPVFSLYAGVDSPAPPANARGRSAERRGMQSRRSYACHTVQARLRRARSGRGIARPAARRVASRRSTRGDFGPRDRTSGVRTGLLNPRSRGFRRVRPSHVQPLKAAPHSWRGRLPLASRRWLVRPSAGAASRSTFQTPPEAPSPSGMDGIYRKAVSKTSAWRRLSPL